MKNILFLSYYFPPHSKPGVKRGPRLVKYLRQMGYRVTVVTKEVGAKGVISLPSPEPTSSGEFVKRKVRLLYRFLKQIFFPDTKLFWSLFNYHKLKGLIGGLRVDLIIASAPPYSTLLCAYLLSLTTGKPYVIDLRDPWLETPLPYEGNSLRWLHRWGERKSLSHARLIITVNERISQNLRERYPGLVVKTITHGFEPDDFRRLRYERGRRFRICWVGTITERRTPRFILEALSGLVDLEWELWLVGEKWIDVQELISQYGLQEKVRLIGRVPYPKALRYMVESDLLWLMVGRGKGAQFVSSSKLFDYLGSGSPILATIPDCAARDVLQRMTGVRIIEPEDIEGIREAIRELYGLWEEDRLPIPRAEEVAPYRMENVGRTLMQCLSNSFDPPEILKGPKG